MYYFICVDEDVTWTRNITYACGAFLAGHTVIVVEIEGMDGDERPIFYLVSDLTDPTKDQVMKFEEIRQNI